MSIIIGDNGLSSPTAFMKKLAVPYLGRPFYVSKTKGPHGEDLGTYNTSFNAELLVPHLEKSIATVDVDDPITDLIAIDSFHITLETKKDLRDIILKNNKDFNLVLTTNQKGAGFNSDMHIIPDRRPGNREIILFDKTITNLSSIEHKSLFYDGHIPFVILQQQQPSKSLLFYDTMGASSGLSQFDNTTLTLNAYVKKISTDSGTTANVIHEYININAYISNALITVILCNRNYKSLMLQ